MPDNPTPRPARHVFRQTEAPTKARHGDHWIDRNGRRWTYKASSAPGAFGGCWESAERVMPAQQLKTVLDTMPDFGDRLETLVSRFVPAGADRFSARGEIYELAHQLIQAARLVNARDTAGPSQHADPETEPFTGFAVGGVLVRGENGQEWEFQITDDPDAVALLDDCAAHAEQDAAAMRLDDVQVRKNILATHNERGWWVVDLLEGSTLFKLPAALPHRYVAGVANEVIAYGDSMYKEGKDTLADMVKDTLDSATDGG